jgi:hypothetical protein
MSDQKVIDKNKLATYKNRMKHDIEILKLDSDFWEYKYKGLMYKTQFAQLEAQLENEMNAFKAEMEKVGLMSENVSVDEIKEVVNEG